MGLPQLQRVGSADAQSVQYPSGMPHRGMRAPPKERFSSCHSRLKHVPIRAVSLTQATEPTVVDAVAIRPSLAEASASNGITAPAYPSGWPGPASTDRTAAASRPPTSRCRRESMPMLRRAIAHIRPGLYEAGCGQDRTVRIG
jgi:hypothetical protein